MRTPVAICLVLIATAALAAPKAELWERWQTSQSGSTETIDHADWADFLSLYVTDHPDGVNRVRYGEVTGAHKKKLATYVDRLEATAVSTHNRPEQLAYWINLYNALTVMVILDNYPVGSIREIKSGWFSSGPWGNKYLLIEGAGVSLDDIEHRILRPIWRDNRIHYALNCASIGCPNLATEPFTPQSTQRLLDQGATEFINHPRAASLSDGALVLSSIYDWFQADFGGDERGVLSHLARFAEPGLVRKLENFKGDIDYFYDWGLNE